MPQFEFEIIRRFDLTRSISVNAKDLAEAEKKVSEGIGKHKFGLADIEIISTDEWTVGDGTEYTPLS